jgi:D-alanyl-D-alanine dipeptidase
VLAILFALLAQAPDAAALVDLAVFDPTLRLDIRYATADNFLARPLYPEARAFLRRPVAVDLQRVQRALAAQGYGLVVFDAYRPFSVTRLMWDLTPPARRGFVADPAKGSNHNRACAVDASLVSLATGREAEMPSAYDEMTPRAALGYAGGPPDARARRDLLRAVMEAAGFRPEPHEWWHFNHRSCAGLPVLDLPFADLPR